MPVVKLSVHGESFMFNMIRHMVGMAVAVARGAIPAAYVEPSLACNSLCTIPLAPPDTLVLSENEFQNFRNNNGVSPAVDASGKFLTLRELGVEQQAAFVASTLSEDMALLADAQRPSWQAWAASLDAAAYDDEAVERWLSQYEVWAVGVAERRALREAKKAAENASVDKTQAHG